MQYKILNAKNIIHYLERIDAVSEYFENDTLLIEEIGDGNINYVFKIQSVQNPKKALILKQAVPFLRCLGEDFSLGRERMTFEIRALENFTKHSGAFVPKLYHTDIEMSVVVMEFLEGTKILRKGLQAQEIYPHFAEHISSFLATNLFENSSLHLDSTQKRELVDLFNSNSQLCAITEDFVFSFAFMEHPTNNPTSQKNELFNQIINDTKLKTEILHLKYRFMTQNDALLHADLHTGSLMCNQEKTFIIDPEFAFVGPFSFDIGVLIAHLVMAYASAKAQEEAYSQWLLEAIEEILEKFTAKFMALWSKQGTSALRVDGYMDDKAFENYQREFIRTMLVDALGFGGVEMMRRIFGAAPVSDIVQIKDTGIQENAIKRTLEIAKNFIFKRDSIQNTKDIMDLIKSR